MNIDKEEFKRVIFYTYRFSLESIEEALQKFEGDQELVEQAAMLADFCGMSLAHGVEDVFKTIPSTEAR